MPVRLAMARGFATLFHMKLVRSLAASFAVAAVVGGSVVSCVQSESMFFVVSAKSLESCGTITTDDPDLSAGRLDTYYAQQYRAILQLGNQLVKRGNPQKLQTETSRIQLQRFDVHVIELTPAGEQELTAFSTSAVGLIEPADQATYGTGLAEATDLIDGATGGALAKRLVETRGVIKIVSRVVAVGRTLGGDEIVTAPWDFPIDVCYGCLCTTPPDDTCEDPVAAPEKIPCLPGQDSLVDCRLKEALCP